MNDYSRWIDDLVRFKALIEALPGDKDVTLKVKPGASESRMAKLDSDLSAELPKSIKSFLRTGSSGMEFRYYWQPSGERASIVSGLFPGKDAIFGGGGWICNIDELVVNRSIALDFGSDFKAEFPEEGALWSRSFPFFELSNGDMLGLYAGENHSDDETEWPVAFLDHDGCGHSRIIESSFDEFMQAWAHLCYISPHHISQYFRNPVSGTIDLESSLVFRLKELFQAN